MKTLRLVCSFALCCLLSSRGFAFPQETIKSQYKLSIVENAGITKRIKKGRVSSQTVIKVTDQNDVPVAGIAVAFTIPQVVGGGAAFVNGTLASFVTTDAAGLASSGSFVTASTGAFSMGVTASVPGGALSLAVPVHAAVALGAAGAGAGAGAGAAGGGAAGAGGAAAGAAAGISAGAIGGIAAAVGAAVVGIAVGVAKGSGNSSSNTTSIPRGTIGIGTGPSVGPPH